MIDRIREYKILGKLGEGGMGTVYLAGDSMLDRQVALKVLNPALTQDTQFVGRFRQEAKVQSSLVHPNIVTLYTFFNEGGHYCMVMEYAEGETLKQVIERKGPIPEERALRLFRQMLDAVGHAHSKGIIHRDIKPSNIMVGPGDSVKVMDFGIAKLMGDRGMTKTGVKMGTLYYMSPEQVRAVKDIDHRTDIYSLGLVLYEMLTGRLPFNTDTESDFEVMQEIVQGNIPGPDQLDPAIPGWLGQSVAKAIASDRANRFPTAAVFLDALKNRTSVPAGETLSEVSPSAVRGDRKGRAGARPAFPPAPQQPSGTGTVGQADRGRRTVSLPKVLAIVFGGFSIIVMVVIFLGRGDPMEEPVRGIERGDHVGGTSGGDQAEGRTKSLRQPAGDNATTAIKPPRHRRGSTEGISSGLDANTRVELESCMYNWHDSMSRFDLATHMKYYGATVRYFQRVVGYDYILNEKRSFFTSGAWTTRKNDMSNLALEAQEDGSILATFNYDCEFEKNTGRVYSVNVDKRIVWEYQGEGWKIVEEKDVRVNENRSHK